ncbi:MAG: hypothetical protein ABJM06_05990 [Gilvibacter sp.]
MKFIKIAFPVLLLLLSFGCTKDTEVTAIIEAAEAPSEVMASFVIEQDNSGLVTITPSGLGATLFTVYYEDGTDEFDDVAVGESLLRTYAEGTYNVRILATGINGKTTEVTQTLVVSFRAPENLIVTVTPDATDNFKISVSATADFATFFEVYFGDEDPEEATLLMLDETIEHSYSAVGEYTLRVVAISGIEGMLEYTEVVSITNPLLLPIDFESPTLDYTFVDFGGATSSVVANPDASGANTSSMVGQLVKGAGSEVWAGSFLTLGEPIDFSTLNFIKMSTWSPTSGIVVKLKLENADNPDINAEVDVVNTVSNGWEELYFDFSGADLTQEYHKVVVFFDFGTAGDGSSYFFDDIDLTVSNADTFEPFQDFEGSAPVFTVFGDIAPTEVVANPGPDAVNGTANVAQLTKSVGAQVWGGTFFELTGQAIEFAGVKKMRLKSYSPTVGSVIKLKLENADASITHEVDMNTTVADAWETLTYDFIDAPAATYTRIVVFYDFGNPGDGSVYYFDEMEAGEGALISTIPDSPIEDFEGAAPTFTSFGDIEDATVAANPNTGGINPSAMAARQVKNAGSQVWAGTFFEVATPLDLDSYNKIRVLTHVPGTGKVVKFKIENADASIVHEVDIVNTVDGDWETMEFDFGDAPAADYVRLVIFFDFGVEGDDSEYFFDQIELTN